MVSERDRTVQHKSAQLDRFFEDINFSLINKKQSFDIEAYLSYVRDELGSYGFDMRHSLFSHYVRKYPGTDLDWLIPRHAGHVTPLVRKFRFAGIVIYFDCQAIINYSFFFIYRIFSYSVYPV